MRALILQAVAELKRRLWLAVLVLVSGCQGAAWTLDLHAGDAVSRAPIALTK